MPKTDPEYTFWIVNLFFLLTGTSFSSLHAVEQNDSIRSYYPGSALSQWIGQVEKDGVSVWVEYDPQRDVFLLYTGIHEWSLSTPILLSPAEYQQYRLRLFRQKYYRWKNDPFLSTGLTHREYNPYLLVNKRKKVSPFGEGGFRFRAQGTVELTLGVKHTNNRNPAQTLQAQKRVWLDFDEKVRLNLQAELGSKLRTDIYYNTESAFEEDARKIKLSYTGEEDEFIRLIEVGQVGLTTHNSLIKGGNDLFGIKSDWQFGKLSVNTLVAQQETEVPAESSSGSIQKTEFEISVANYDHNQHFFLAHYFRETYDETLATLPRISSSVNINRIEVWVTNKQRQFEQSRNVVAFTDLAEYRVISHPDIVSIPSGSGPVPSNKSNTLYEMLLSSYPGVRNIQQVNQSLTGFLQNGLHFEKIESARLLDVSEYTLHEQLGYISLSRPLDSDQTLGVAFEYSYKGEIYQVGEFSTDRTGNNTDCLFIKLVRGITLSPDMPYWQLMMKNIYSLPVRSVKKESFKMDILFQHDSLGLRVSYLPEGNISNPSFLHLLGADRLDQNLNLRPDGIFDFVDKYTVMADKGKVIFPSTEPFGSYLKQKIGDENVASRYVFQELYDSTSVYITQIPEKNKFVLRGEMRSEQTAQGALVANLTQRKTVVGVELLYEFSKNLSGGVTMLHLSERPLEYKNLPGGEAIKNTLWGAHLNYRLENTTFTKRLNRFPLFELKQPFRFFIKSEFARLNAGRKINKEYGDYTWLDDFETAKASYLLSEPTLWQLSATPRHDIRPLFPEASLTNDISYGKNRALLAWYIIDPFLTGRISGTPSHLQNDKEQLSNHYIREVAVTELFPSREQTYTEVNRLPIFNIAFYPDERGPYNLDSKGVNTEGKLTGPQNRWGGIMRKIEQTNFEAANIEYIEFWLMDPFIYNKETTVGGDLYFNLGEVSEDILKDGKKFFENGLPADGDSSRIETTVWGKVPKQQHRVMAFEQDESIRGIQDVGLNGLSTEEEKLFPAYKTYLEEIKTRISGETFSRWQQDPFSPLHDPAGDNFHHFREEYYDREETDILTRYKRYNGTEGNSRMGDKYTGKYLPDTEDINGDNIMNEQEQYFEYKISLRPGDLVPRMNHITATRTATVNLENGNKENVTWYHFKIPVKQFDRRIGNLRDFSSIRFMRLYLTGFSQPVILRMASFGLVRGEWRVYEQNDTSVEVSVVNLEEDNERTPVNYVLPPGIERTNDLSQGQLTRQNEQSLSIRIKELEAGDFRAVYKSVSHNLRHYKSIQLFVHAEAIAGDETALQDEDLSLFLRLGSDYRNNYYEYEVPLILTPPGQYNLWSPQEREKVWPELNKIYFDLSVLTELKQKRNRRMNEINQQINMQTFFQEQDPAHLRNKIGIKGNPSLAEISVLMIGVRNRSKDKKQVEVWVNELRLAGYEERNGWAIKNELIAELSDIGVLTGGNSFESAGFGDLHQTVSGRRMENYAQYNFSASLQLGTFFPASLHVRLPFSYSLQKEKSTPLYNPFDTDILLSDAFRQPLFNDKTLTQNLSFTGVNLGVKSRVPMPYDPANFTFSYAYNKSNHRSPETLYENSRTHTATVEYHYTPPSRSLSIKGKREVKNKSSYLRQLEFFYLPAQLSFTSYLYRYYYEIEKRVYRTTGQDIPMPLSFIQDFTWKRKFLIRWNLTRHLQASFQSGTEARIEEPHMQVNRKLNPDRYQVWKDSVRQSILHLGQPLQYDQDFTVIYQFPFAFIPALSWSQGAFSYQARYNWERMGDRNDSIWTGNNLQNQRVLKYQGGFNLISLYNKNQYLRDVNRSFQATGSGMDQNRILLRYITRFLMMVRQINLSYEKMDGMILSGFYPEAGDLLGQRKYRGEFAPGLKFAFGAVQQGYIEKAVDKRWLLIKEENNTPAVINKSKKWMAQILVEPLHGLRIEFSADRIHTNTTRIEYVYPDIPPRYGGSFTMTTVAIASIMKKRGTPRNNYTSASFESFLSNREIISRRVDKAYTSLTYPQQGFLADSPYGGQSYRQGSFRKESAEVLIPSFMAAYRGKDPEKITLDFFPSLLKLVPNWKITYDGLGRIPFLKNYFRSIHLSHQYRGVYNILSYGSYLSWVSAGGKKGFIPSSPADSAPVPSSPYQISSVNLTDGFTPLAGIDATLINNLSIHLQYRTSRNLHLSITSQQLNEHSTAEYQVGVGYRTMELAKLFPRIRSRQNNSELTFRGDFSYQKGLSLARKIEEGYSELTAGNKTVIFRFSAEYALSRYLTCKAFFDWEKMNPLLSENAYPTTTVRGGLSLLVSIDRGK